MDSYIVKKIENEFANKRFLAELKKKEAFENLYKNFPDLLKLEDEKRLIASNIKLSKEERRDKVKVVDEKIGDFIRKNNIVLPEKKYGCENCKDTGISNGKRCSCFIKRVIEESLSEDTLTDENQCFENFDESLFPEDEKKQALDVKKYCQAYSENFPNVKKPNIVLSGKTGTGKTFLLSSIALNLKKKGISAVYITAGRMFDILRKYAFNQINDIDILLDAQMLIIDDLGTEPLFNNITIEYIFMLVNERTRNKKAMCISTNLTPDELKKRYTERITSRLLDTNTTNIFRFDGKDLRIRK